MIIHPPKRRKKKLNGWNNKGKYTSYGKKTIDDDLITKPKTFKWKPVDKPTKGEANIMDFLTKHGIVFVREKQFKGLLNPDTRQPLRMDFYLKELNVCIEFDGRQHFEVCKRWNMTEIDLHNQKMRDSVKNDFCIRRKIKMIRIHYKDINKVAEILLRELGM